MFEYGNEAETRQAERQAGQSASQPVLSLATASLDMGIESRCEGR